MKKVRFNKHVMVYIIPKEDRTGHWVMDVCRFKARISKVERAIGWCLIQKEEKIYIHMIYTMDQNELQNKIELIEDSISDINDTVIDINKDIVSINKKLDCVAVTFVIAVSFGVGYILGSKYLAAQI